MLCSRVESGVGKIKQTGVRWFHGKILIRRVKAGHYWDLMETQEQGTLGSWEWGFCWKWKLHSGMTRRQVWLSNSKQSHSSRLREGLGPWLSGLCQNFVFYSVHIEQKRIWIEVHWKHRCGDWLELSSKGKKEVMHKNWVAIATAWDAMLDWGAVLELLVTLTVWIYVEGRINRNCW